MFLLLLRKKTYFSHVIYIFSQLWRELEMLLEFLAHFENSKLKNEAR